jgi:hypothetical protein
MARASCSCFEFEHAVLRLKLKKKKTVYGFKDLKATLKAFY